MITVKDLRDRLAEFEDNEVIYMSSDEEGNTIDPLREVEGGHFFVNKQGEFFYEEELSLSEQKNMKRAIVLWP